MAEKEVTTDWEQKWKNHETGWDCKRSAPSLVHFVDSINDGSYSNDKVQLDKLKKGFIGGVGSGYDVFALSKLKTMEKVIGLDISPTAHERANSLKEKESENVKEKCEFICGDFFKFADESSEKPFDVIFDYTFLCAIPPSMREDWAKSMGKILNKEHGILVTLVFPISRKKFFLARGVPEEKITEDAIKSGPPFQLDLDSVNALMKGNNFELVSIEDAIESVEERKGNEKFAIWKLKE